MKSNSMYLKPIVELEILKIVDQLETKQECWSLGTLYQKHWKNPKQLDISEISLNKNLFKIMTNFDFWACACLVWFQ